MTELLPAKRKRGPAFALMTVLLFVMTMTAAAGLGLFNGSRILVEASGERHLVQVPAGIEQAGALEEFLAAREEVETVEATGEAELRATLAEWLGPTAEEAELPLPALVTVELLDNAEPDALRAALAEEFPDARMSSQEALLAPMLGALRSVAALGLGLVVAIGVAAAVAVTLATRAALTANAQGIAVLHGMGATDAQVAKSFEGRIAMDALLGGAIGTVAALVTIFSIMAGAGEGLQFLMGGRALLGPLDAPLLLLLPILGAALAFVVARATIMRDLARQP